MTSYSHMWKGARIVNAMVLGRKLYIFIEDEGATRNAQG
jgi:hypothetical protein